MRRILGTLLLAYYRYKQTRKLLRLGLKKHTSYFEGCQIHYYSNPHFESKKNLILIHGFLDSSLTFRYNISSLLSSFNLYIVDIPGFAKSTLPSYRELWHFDSISRTLARFFTSHLLLNEFSILTHSMGGLVSIHIYKYLKKYHKNVKIKSLHMIAPGLLQMSAKYREKIRAEFYPKTLKDVQSLINNLSIKNDKKSPRWLLQALLREWSNIGYEFLALNTLERESEIFFTPAKLKQIKIKVVLYWGLEDNVVPIQKGHTIKKNIAGCKLEVFEQCGHALHQEESDLFNQTLLAHFQ